MTDPRRVLVATVAEDRPLARIEVEILFRSLRRFGCSLSRSRCAVRFIDSVDQATARRLESLGVDVDVTSGVAPRSPHANKIRMLENVGDVEVVVALDHDLAVAGDLSAILNRDSVGAKPEDLDPLTNEQWVRLYSHLGLELPAERFRTTFTWAETVPYFNTGVIGLPGRYARLVHDTWLVQVRRLLDAAGHLPEIARWRIYQEQMAFPTALVAARIPFHALPLEMNFPTHAPVHPAWNPEVISPVVLHHHHRLWSDGRLMSTGYQVADERIAAVNELIVDEMYDVVRDAVSGLPAMGPDYDVCLPFPGTWWAQIESHKARIDALIPERDILLLVDEQQFGASIAGSRVVLPFPEVDGQFTGPPVDDDQAIAELQRQRRLGARWLVFLKPAFWWLEHYRGLQDYLCESSSCVHKDDHVVAYRLRDPPGPRSPATTVYAL
jgi:hypothetical protein